MQVYNEIDSLHCVRFTYTFIDQRNIRKKVVETLSNCLLEIIRYVNEKKDHIPPITKPDAFPYQVALEIWFSLA